MKYITPYTRDIVMSTSTKHNAKTARKTTVCEVVMFHFFFHIQIIFDACIRLNFYYAHNNYFTFTTYNI